MDAKDEVEIELLANRQARSSLPSQDDQESPRFLGRNKCKAESRRLLPSPHRCYR